MKNLLLLLVLANVLYLLWGMFVEPDREPGVAIVDESQLGPPLDTANAGAVGSAGETTRFSGAAGRSCVSIGPFSETTEADDALIEYQNQRMRSAVRKTQTEVFVGHWVQIRNVINKESANAMLKRLNEGGITDAYNVPNDDGSINISLGLFAESERAEKVELQAKSLNLPADITPRMEEREVYFVDVALPPGRGAGAIVTKFGEEKVLLRDRATCPASR